MPESSDVKELAKELARESAKKLTSSLISMIRGDDKKSHSSSNTPPSNVHSPGIANLSTKFDALSLGGRNDTGMPNLSAKFDALSLGGRDDTFVGGFNAPVPPQTLTPWPPNDLSFTGGSANNYRPSFPVPVVGPLPRPPMSLTMEHALSTPTAAYPGSTNTNIPPPRPNSTSALPPPNFGLAAPTKSNKSNKSTPSSPRPASKRSRSSSSSTSSDAVQCNGVTKAGSRCTRLVKAGPPLAQVNPDVDIERFCYQHTKEVLVPTGFYSKKNSDNWIKFEDWIPDYLQADTQTALRSEMSKPNSASDVPGYIYTFEIRDDVPGEIKLKVGRAVNLVKRIDQWGKQCGSKEQVLRGWWPDEEDNAVHGSLVKGIVRAGEKGSYCHKLERLVHLELADLSINAPYLDPHFPKVNTSDTTSSSAGSSSHPHSRKSGYNSKKHNHSCADCGQVHKEIFIFLRVEQGRYAGKEWEKLVKPVIEKWGAFVEAYV